MADKGPVTCLGMTFENDEARRTHFTQELRKKLKDPEFRKIEGFPIGEDEDILALSDPPYYTACPNPWIADFIEEWEAQKPEKPNGYQYHREPFAADVSEGKNDPIYNAHSYHTKVPHKAIMRYILHYTDPGDIVFDGFCGTGMTGVAAQMCGERDVVMSLGYQVKRDGTILQEEMNEDGSKVWRAFSKIGVRRAVLNDLSPAATFIAYNYNTQVDVAVFEKEAKCILKDVEKECGWMYETKHSDGRTGKINFTVWSDVFVCPNCAQEVVFWDVAVDKENDCLRDKMSCPHCSIELTKSSMNRAWVTKYDSSIGGTIKQAKQTPVAINYAVGSKNYKKTPDKYDIDLIEKLDQIEVPYWHPSDLILKGDKTGEPIRVGITHVQHFYTNRNLWGLAACVEKSRGTRALFAVTAIIRTLTKMFRWAPKGKHTAGTSGNLYIPSITHEYPIFKALNRRIHIYEGLHKYSIRFGQSVATMCTSSANTSIGDDSLDYLFIDPPFGANLNYSELNFLWETWLRVQTENTHEAIENRTQKKGTNEYRHIMTSCFKEAYRVLKPGRWMTVEFSNTKAAVWNSIQTSLTDAGFIVANVAALDKKQGSFNAVNNPTSVKQDLVISAYKPNGGFEERFQKGAKTEEGVWEFVRTHLKYLPVIKRQGDLMLFVHERDPRILFDQMVAFYVRKGYPVPISSQEFQVGLSQRFSEREGMYFLPDQAAEYDRKNMLTGEMVQASLFVSDETSAIQWLRQVLKQKPQTFSDLNPQFMRQLGGWSKNEAQLDLRELLNQNFLLYNENGPVPEQIHSYLSSNWKDLRNLPKDALELVAKAKDRWYVPDPTKAGDLEKLRERALLKEFETYVQRAKKFSARDKFRLEALRTGFKRAWQNRDYELILNVAAKIPDKILEEDPHLLMWRDNAQTRLGDD